MAISQLSSADDADSGLRMGLFDDDGLPTESAKKLFGRNGSFPAPIRGVDIPIAAPDQNGLWKTLDDAVCLSVRFRVATDGLIDRFEVLDSQPPDALKPAVLAAMKEWKFEQRATPQWAILPLSFSYVEKKPGNSVNRNLGKSVLAPVGKSADCLIPKRDQQISLPDGAEQDSSHWGVFPSAQMLRARGAGCVTLAFRIAGNGKPTDIELLDAKPNDAYASIAASDVEAWQIKLTPKLKPQYGFARIGYMPMPQGYPVPDCMDADFAAKHYQPSESVK